MIEMEIKKSIQTFNKLIDSLISSFSKYNLDEHAIIFLTKKTKNLMGFTHKIIIKLLFRFFKSATNITDKINLDLLDIDTMLELVYAQLNKSLNNLLNSNYDENRQRYIDDIIQNLTFLKDIINNLSYLFISALKFQADIIKEDELRQDYQEFKNNIQKDKNDINTYQDKKDLTEINIE